MSTGSKTSVGFALACLVIFFAMMGSNRTTSKFIDQSAWTVHEVEIRSQIENLSTSFLEAQNNLRAYHITEQDYYLDFYKRGRERMQRTLTRLQELTRGNEIQQQNLEQVAKILEKRMAAWDLSFEIHQRSGWREIRRRMMGTQGKNNDLQLFAALDTFKLEQDRALASRIESTEAQGESAMWMIWIGGVLALLLVVIAAIVVSYDTRRRLAAEADIDRFFTLSLDLLCISGMDGYFKRLSPSYADVLGYSLEELYSRPITDFIHPEDIDRTNREIESQAKGNKVLAFENRFRCRDGSYKTLSWKSVPVESSMYAVARDVTQQKKFENDLVLAREAAQQAATVKSEFLANMSHEIRTPLNGVVGMTDLLHRTKLDPEQDEFVRAIRSSAAGLIQIVNEILDFSKIEAGQMRFEKADFSLTQLIERQVSLIGVLAAEKNLRLSSEVDPAIPKVLQGDAGKIGQVVLNLLNNAVKFTDAGSIEVHAEIKRGSETASKIRISVHDTGIGMDPEQVSHLFEPFVQADGSTARRFGGTGLGLSISKKLVQLMGGEIGVRSRSGEGSTFWFDVSLAHSERSLEDLETAGVRPVEVTEEQKSRRKNIRVLVAEDNRVNQTIIIGMLQTLGYAAFLAKNGQEAVSLYGQSAFDLILMDQHMPVMDGLTASREIRGFEKRTGHRTPIIAFTATVLQEDQREKYRDLMDDFLLKPVTLEMLEKTLSRWEGRVASS